MFKNFRQELPVTRSCFDAIRLSNQIYVDKTALIHKIASQTGKFLLIRPRLFGKSMLISTMESLFKSGIKGFEGLAIEKLWKDTGTYNVASICFSLIQHYQDFPDFLHHLKGMLYTDFCPFGFAYDPNSETPFFEQFSSWLATVPDRSLVILIDGYEAPLRQCLHDPAKFAAVADVLSGFYKTLETHDRKLRFVFVTGPVKFKGADFFADWKDFTDLTFDPDYAALTGFVPEELETWFGEYLDYAAEVTSLNRPELLKKLSERYGGYCFDKTATTRVLQPSAVVRFLNNPGRDFREYWFQSGGNPEDLLRDMNPASRIDPADYAREKTLHLKDWYEFPDFLIYSGVGLLTQTGYLTIRSIKESDTAIVDFPNTEVRQCFARMYVSAMLNRQIPHQVGAGYIERVLIREDAPSLVDKFNTLFAAVVDRDHTLDNVRSLSALVQAYFDGYGHYHAITTRISEKSSSLEVDTGMRRRQLEFRFCQSADDAGNMLEEAIQDLRSRQFEPPVPPNELIRVALVFSAKDKQFVQWQKV